ncbi:MAG: FKBP-type peptidyl-prolyl cis-trans isomerase FklB [Acidobacteria bacterium]|nr:FKBP-type peptidyl-prolyl cis-trans isomerase FklB [Acidobacteriota bacterium]
MNFAPILLALLFADAPQPQSLPVAELTNPAADAQRSVTGLYSKQLAAGTGKTTPNEDSFVKIRYAIWTSEGKLIDAIEPPKVALVPLPKMMPGIREALLGMTEGEKRRLWIPEDLGARGRVPAGGRLIGDVELVEIVKLPTAPADGAQAPDDAIKTHSGLAYKVLRPGTGTKHPKDSDYVRVNYSGWTTNGNLFDSTVLRGNPSELAVQNVIAGWREGLKLMTEGSIVRMWIPSKLAYDRQPGKPMGMLVFDVELVDIE